MVMLEEDVNIQYHLTVCYLYTQLPLYSLLYIVCVHIHICIFYHLAAQKLSYQLFIFIQNGKRFMDKRNLSLCLSQISLESFQELQALTKLNQCLEGWLTLVLS